MDLEQFKSDIIPLRPKLLIIACKMLENEEEAEDVVQEVLLRLWSMRDRLNELDSPAAFGMQIVKNNCIDRIRTKRQSCDIEEFNIGNCENTPYTELERRDSVAIVKEIIERLPELQRQIIRMRDIEGYELNEIAEITGTQATAVSMNLSRARKKVRDTFALINKFQIPIE